MPNAYIQFQREDSCSANTYSTKQIIGLECFTATVSLGPIWLIDNAPTIDPTVEIATY